MSDTNQPGAAAARAAERTQQTIAGVTDRARQVGQDAAEAGQTLAGRAADSAKELGQEARDRGASLLDEVGDRVQREAGARKEDAADRIEHVAEALRRSGEGLEGNEAWIAGLVERGAAELSSLAETLRANDFRALMGRIERMAHEQPALFVGASMAAGFALVRLGRVAAAGATAPRAEAGQGAPKETAPMQPPVQPQVQPAVQPGAFPAAEVPVP